ncbi:acetyltransferase (GNAT) family protein [Maribacter vaceletii]|uniref:Acetyltransferase (GNAT) family protein n=1 Tax=Maribacter vaceletii TaxID=1206816 RepID=A0A495E832_9FLAO|nr:GNAT family N-acetyltransferase [Maribacter vaceletii]RKR12956.1 acetyltransferase (GNAT) family protein [Maribacter vaceletii]
MNSKLEILLIPQEELHTILPLVYELNNGKTSNKILEERLIEMKKMNFQCIGVYDVNKLIGICGFWILNKFYIGKHIEPDNVYIAKEYRSRGVGKLMLDWIYEYAKENNCNSSEINCYVKNTRGVQFWEEQGYTPEGYHMRNVFDRNNE